MKRGSDFLSSSYAMSQSWGAGSAFKIAAKEGLFKRIGPASIFCSVASIVMSIYKNIIQAATGSVDGARYIVY